MAKKTGSRGGVFGTVEEARAKATELGGKWRVFTVNGRHVVAGSEGHALHLAWKAGHVEATIEGGRTVTVEAAIAALAKANLTPEQKAELKKVAK